MQLILIALGILLSASIAVGQIGSNTRVGARTFLQAVGQDHR